MKYVLYGSEREKREKSGAVLGHVTCAETTEVLVEIESTNRIAGGNLNIHLHQSASSGPVVALTTE